MDDAGKIFGDEASWQGAVQRLGHCHADHLGFHKLGKGNAMAYGALAELGAVVGSRMHLYMR